MKKPAEDPKPHELEKQAPISEASAQQPEEPADDLHQKIVVPLLIIPLPIPWVLNRQA